jgi:hypothetical protein
MVAKNFTTHSLIHNMVKNIRTNIDYYRLCASRLFVFFDASIVAYIFTWLSFELKRSRGTFSIAIMCNEIILCFPYAMRSHLCKRGNIYNLHWSKSDRLCRCVRFFCLESTFSSSQLHTRTDIMIVIGRCITTLIVELQLSKLSV